MIASIPPADHTRRAWRASARLLACREEELRATTAHWEQGLVAFHALRGLEDEVHALRAFERELFDKAHCPYAA